MKVIAVLSRKGGVGKSLIATGLSQVLGQAGYKTALLDRDPEGSAVAFREGAEELGIVLPYQIVNAIEAVSLSGIEYLVIDTPPNDEKTMLSTAKQAHFIVVPVLPGDGEIDRLQKTVETLSTVAFQAGTRLGFVPNKVGNDNLSRALTAVLEDLGYTVVAEVKKAVEYARSFGGLYPPELVVPFEAILNNLEVLPA